MALSKECLLSDGVGRALSEEDNAAACDYGTCEGDILVYHVH